MTNTNNGYIYKAFGLNLFSELPFDELTPGTGKPDVYIRYGHVPNQLNDPKATGVRYQVKPGALILNIDSIAKYFIQNGSNIIIQKNTDRVCEHEIRLFLLGPAIGTLLLQRGLLPIHGSSLTINGKTAIFAGMPGSGKSTLAAGLIRQGYKIISDDISVVDLKQQSAPNVIPGFPQMKLWGDVIEKLNTDLIIKRQLRAGIKKFGIDINKYYNEEPALLNRIYILCTSNKDKFEILPVKGMDRFTALKNNTYRRQFIEGLGIMKEHFNQCMFLANKVPVMQIIRPRQPFRLNELIRLVKKDLEK
jgi:hypothetical protein